METKDNDRWRILFSTMPDEELPAELDAKVMRKIYEKAALQNKKSRFWELCVYASGIAVMLITAIIAYYNMDVSFKLPEIRPLEWSFPPFDFNMFTTPAFGLSFRVGALALALLIVDSLIRRAMEKNKNKSRVN